jgi:Xaa-Pro dipeptidase
MDAATARVASAAAPSTEELRRLHADHVARLQAGYESSLAASGFDAVVLHSGSLKSRSSFDDQYWPLRPTPHFQHWVPLASPDCALVVRAGHKPRLVWLKEQNFWEKPGPLEHDHWLGQLDIVEIHDVARAVDHFPSGRVAFIGEDLARAASWKLETVNPPSLVKPLDQLRVHKTAYEIACINEANRRASLGHAAVARAFRDGDRSELDLHLVFLQATGQDDPETPYKNIVALGPHAATLHHISYGRRAEKRPAESLLLDAGACFEGYCSDITRTFVKGSGAAATTFADLVARVESMQQRLCSEAKPGLPYERLHERSHEEVGAILTGLGIARMSADEAVASGLTRAFYPHGLGHSLGLQCHDVGCAEMKPKPNNPFLRNTTVIARDQVFTIEPGVYFIDMLLAPLRASEPRVDWKLVDALAPLGGVRIEDDVRVIDGGIDNLTRAYLAG